MKHAHVTREPTCRYCGADHWRQQANDAGDGFVQVCTGCGGVRSSVCAFCGELYSAECHKAQLRTRHPNPHSFVVAPAPQKRGKGYGPAPYMLDMAPIAAHAIRQFAAWLAKENDEIQREHFRDVADRFIEENPREARLSRWDVGA